MEAFQRLDKYHHLVADCTVGLGATLSKRKKTAPRQPGEGCLGTVWF